MLPESFEEQRLRHNRMRELLGPLGWIPVGTMIFLKGSKVYDLSAADLTQIDRIEAEGLFVMAS